jgi:site-specific recombinase XerD
MDKTLTQTGHNSLLIPEGGNKDATSRARLYTRYLDEHNLRWYRPDLVSYTAYLEQRGLAPSSIEAHLSSIRRQYRRVMKDRDLFYRMVDPAIEGPADRKAFVDEILARIKDAIDPGLVDLDTVTTQDHTDEQRVRLTVAEANALMLEPVRVYGRASLRAMRDTALLSLMLCTGIREAEAAALNVIDLRQYVDGEMGLLVRHGKGNKQRLVPYGDLTLGLELAEKWLRAAGVQDESAPVFWSFLGRDHELLRGRLSTRRISDLVRSYTVWRDGQYITVAPHDLRRTYARRQYDAGMGLNELRLNMGHTTLEMTAHYVGDTNIRDRRNRAVFSYAPTSPASDTQKG